VTLRGPVWWAADGSRIAVRARRDESSDVVAVDYGSGESVWICRGAEVVDLAWSPGGERVAYVTEEEPGRAVWLQTLPPGEARRLSDGGFDLRWSLDGQSLRWLRPRSREVWVRATWDGGTGEVAEASPQPARPAGTMWSPDGQRCAVLQSSEGGEEGRLLIYTTQGTVAEEVPLPYVRPTRLLGWSPDGRLVLVLGGADFPVAVAAMPMDDAVRAMVEVTTWPSGERGTICGYPIEAEAGPPSWSSGCDTLAYVPATKMDERLGAGPDDEFPNGCLVAQIALRRHIEPPTPEQVETHMVLSNVKNVALALQMYLADNNDVFPPSGESEEVWSILDEYVKNRSVFMRPGTEDEMVTQYLVPPGVPIVEIPDPPRFPVAVVDYLPDVCAVAYADGHAAMREKGDGYWEELMAPWEEYWAEREEGD
jgi:dipeptidyl aminopeptidase/acylaminoacyl peptidase